MCINEDWRNPYYGCPSFGDIDEVEYTDTSKGLHYYALARFPKVLHLASHFAPVSDIDETEMVREYKIPEHA